MPGTAAAVCCSSLVQEGDLQPTRQKEEQDAIEELGNIFPPMLKDVTNVDHKMATTTATMVEVEVGWTGIKGEIVAGGVPTAALSGNHAWIWI